jgi:hypothetical protein
MSIRIREVILGLAIFLITAEAGSFLVVVFLQHRAVLYKPHSDLSDYEDYITSRDPVLGWTKLKDEDRVMLDGSRYSPAFPDSKNHSPCVSLYGDSFVWADEVNDEDAWGNQLAEILGCRVANYGVRAYGTDQAYLRYLYKASPNAGQVVILSHFSENVLRNVTQDFDLLYGLTKYGLKPRFLLSDSGELQLIPIPDLTAEEFAQLNQSPEAVLTHQYLMPLHARFPYAVSLVHAVGNYRIQAKFRDEPFYAAFYHPNHPSNALPITTAILSAFVKEARKRNERPLVLLIPHSLDLRYFQSTGRWTYQPLLEALERRDIPFIDAGPAIYAEIATRDIQSFYAPKSHLNEEGNKFLAAFVQDALARPELIPPTTTNRQER